MRTHMVAAVALALLLVARPAAGQAYPDEPADGVADLARVLTPADADDIRSMLQRMREQAGVEVRVLTVQSVDGFRTGDATPEAFATGVYNAWTLGYGQRHDGVLVLLSVDDRFTRIELGDGVPADQDARMRAIVDDVMVPRFRDGDMSRGLRDGVVAVARSFGAAPAARIPTSTLVGGLLFLLCVGAVVAAARSRRFAAYRRQWASESSWAWHSSGSSSYSSSRGSSGSSSSSSSSSSSGSGGFSGFGGGGGFSGGGAGGSWGGGGSSGGHSSGRGSSGRW